jgi:hypothetical protein
MHKRFLAVGALLAAGCIDTDTAVFVDASVEAPSLTVGGGGLGVTLQGSFILDLHLGARASGTSQVTYSSFSLKAADDTVLVESLPVTPDKASPVSVEPGSTVAVSFTIDTGSSTLPVDLKDRICAGQVKVSGVVEDSLESESSPVESAAFAPSGC